MKAQNHRPVYVLGLGVSPVLAFGAEQDQKCGCLTKMAKPSKRAVSKRAVSKRAVSSRAVSKRAVSKRAVSSRAVSNRAVSNRAVS